MNSKAAIICTLALALGGCVGVPDKLSTPHLHDQAPLAGLPSQADARWPDAAWWRRFNDPQLNRLMHQAMADSTTLAIARQRVALAAQAARVTAVSNGVKLNGSAQVARQRLSEHGLIPAQFLGFTWYNQADIGAQLNYSFDWWGKHHASVQAAIGKARAARAGKSVAAIALQSAVADTYFAWQADQTRLALAEEILQAQSTLVRIAKARTHAGVQPADAQLQGEAALAAARQHQTQIEGIAAIHYASLAALLGTSPAALGRLTIQPLPMPDAQLPAHAGLDLIARRPDIAASRWQVDAALRETDVARAAFLPDLSLSAMAGLSSIDLGKLLSASSRTFALTPALHLPIFESGLLKAQYGLSHAQLNAAIANYHDAVMQAAREVAQQTLTVKNMAELGDQQRQQLQATTALLATRQSRYRRGVTDLEPVLQARLGVLQQRDADAVLKARAVSADIALIHALGGGYHDASAAPPTPINTATRNPPHD